MPYDGRRCLIIDTINQVCTYIFNIYLSIENRDGSMRNKSIIT